MSRLSTRQRRARRRRRRLYASPFFVPTWNRPRPVQVADVLGVVEGMSEVAPASALIGRGAAERLRAQGVDPEARGFRVVDGG